MHRDKELWGPDGTYPVNDAHLTLIHEPIHIALEFDPDRFLDERVAKYLTPNPFIFLPFNAGPRICLGQQFAYNESSFFVIKLLQAIDTITLAPDAQPAGSLPPASWKSKEGRAAIEQFVPGVHLTMYAKDGLWVRMKEVKATED